MSAAVGLGDDARPMPERSASCCGDRFAGRHDVSQAAGHLLPLVSFSCSARHITLPVPDFGRLSTNSTMRGTL